MCDDGSDVQYSTGARRARITPMHSRSDIHRMKGCIVPFCSCKPTVALPFRKIENSIIIRRLVSFDVKVLLFNEAKERQSVLGPTFTAASNECGFAQRHKRSIEVMKLYKHAATTTVCPSPSVQHRCRPSVSHCVLHCPAKQSSRYPMIDTNAKNATALRRYLKVPQTNGTGRQCGGAGGSRVHQSSG
jgi:hypothetical protein